MRIAFPRYPLTACALAISLALAGCGGDSPEKLVAAAKGYLDKNDAPAATIQLKNALAKDPNNAEARFLLGRALLENNDPVNAEIELKKAVELKYPADKVTALLAKSLAARGQARKVVEEYGKVTLADADANAELKTTVATAYGVIGERENARAALDAALKSNADYPPALLIRAQYRLLEEDVPGALAIADGILAKDPRNVEALIFKGRVSDAQGKKDEAIAFYRKVLEVKPNYLAVHGALIQLYMRDNNLDMAQKQLDAMRLVSTKNPQTLYYQAVIAFQKKDIAQAKESIQGVLKVLPNDVRSLQLAGWIEYETRSDLQAQEYLSRALSRAPELEVSRQLLIRSYLRSGQLGKAVTTLEPALAADKQPSSAMYAVAGETYMQLGDAAKAESFFTKASKADPSNAKSRTALALLHAAAGNPERGVSELEQIAANDAGSSADMALIAAHMRQKQYDQALKQIAALEKKQPDNLNVHNMRAAALMGKNDLPGARKSLEKAVSMDPGYLPAASSLAQLDLADKKPDDAFKRFETVLAKDPKNVQAYLAQAQIRAKNGGKPDEVAGLIKKAISANPSEAASRVALINYYMATRDTKSAVAAADEAMSSLPERAEILDAAGQALQANGNLDRALQVYGKLITQLPNAPASYLRMADIQLANKNPDGARDTINKGLVAQPESVALLRAITKLDVDAKRFDDAVSRARVVQKKFPKQQWGYMIEGDTQVMKKDMPAALSVYRSGLKQVDSTDLAMRVYGVQSDAGQAAEAAKFADEWLKGHPKDVNFRTFVADQLAARKDYVGAIAQYRRVLEDSPNNPVILNNLAWSMGKQGDPKALGFAEQANKIVPNQPMLLDTLGVLLVEQGQGSRGVETLKKAVSLAPDNASIRLNLARGLIKSGQKSEAKAELETLAKLGDKFSGQAEVASLMKSL